MEVREYNSTVTVIIPVFNDEEVLPELYRRLNAVLGQITESSEIIFIDDGSGDGSMKLLEEIHSADETVKIIQLTRNFGQQNAIAAGLEYSYGELVILMDSDLQDRPEDIPVLIDAMMQSKVPMAVAGCSSRGDSSLKIAASKAFNSFANQVTSVHFVPGMRVFRVIKREIVNDLLQLSEKTATPLSLLGWMGYDYVVIDLDRDRRYAGASGYTFKRMLRLSLDRIFSFSLLPIRLSSILGVILGFSSVILALYFILQKLFFRSILPGWTSIVVILLFLLGMNFIFIGVLGEYLGRIYMEVKDRPRYVINRVIRKQKEAEK